MIYNYVLLFILSLYKPLEINVMISQTSLWLVKPTQMKTPGCTCGRTIPGANTGWGSGEQLYRKGLRCPVSF